MYVLNPEDYNARTGDRFIIYDDISKKVFKKIILSTNERLEIKYTAVLKNIDNYKFKFQTQKDGKWKDSHRYFKLIRTHQLGDYWTDLTSLNENS